MTIVIKGLLGSAAVCAFVLHFPAGTPARAGERTIYSFCGDPQKATICTDGMNPQAALTDVNGTLYGTTYNGWGGNDFHAGTVFSVDPKTGDEKVLHWFGNPDGEYPNAGLVDVNGILYGTTSGGGALECSGYGCGVVYALDPKSGSETVIHSFQVGGDGYQPYAGLTKVNRILYGTTSGGGQSGRGTVFSLDPKTDVETVLYSFCGTHQCTDGSTPEAGLINVKDTLYGTTPWGGGFPTEYGVVFSINLKTGAETTLHTFGIGSDSDGQYSLAGLTNVDGTLYGTTKWGGAYGGGTVFSIKLKAGTYKVLHSFCSQHYCTDGANPVAALIGVNGILYGTTGGGSGSVFSINPRTGTFKVLYSFCSQHYCTDGLEPMAALINVNGTLYGTTYKGGSTRNGTVFSIER